MFINEEDVLFAFRTVFKMLKNGVKVVQLSLFKISKVESRFNMFVKVNEQVFNLYIFINILLFISRQCEPPWSQLFFLLILRWC